MRVFLFVSLVVLIVSLRFLLRMSLSVSVIVAVFVGWPLLGVRLARLRGFFMASRKSSGRLPGPHSVVPGTVDGFFVCSCGCGYVGVCSHCVSGFGGKLPWFYCRAERRRLKVGEYAELQGGVL